MNSLIFHVPTVVFSLNIGAVFFSWAAPKPTGPVYHRQNGWRGGMVLEYEKLCRATCNMGSCWGIHLIILHSNQYRQLGRTLGAPKVETKSAHTNCPRIPIFIDFPYKLGWFAQRPSLMLSLCLDPMVSTLCCVFLEGQISNLFFFT